MEKLKIYSLYQLRENMIQKRVNKMIEAQFNDGWTLDRVDAYDSSLISPSGHVYKSFGSFVDDGSELDYELKSGEDKKEFDHAVRIYSMLKSSYRYLLPDFRWAFDSRRKRS